MPILITLRLIVKSPSIFEKRQLPITICHHNINACQINNRIRHQRAVNHAGHLLQMGKGWRANTCAIAHGGFIGYDIIAVKPFGFLYKTHFEINI